MRLPTFASAMLTLATALATSVAHALVCPTILAGSCWNIGQAVITGVGWATAGDRSVRCSLRCLGGGGTLMLNDDGTYTTPGAGVTALECPSGSTVVVPEEQGTVRQKRGRLVLVPGNVGAFDAALGSCVGRNLKVLRYRTWLRIAPDGQTLRGVSRLRYVIPGREPITTKVTARFTATRAITMPASQPFAAPGDGPVPACAPDLPVRCVIS